MTVIYAVLLLIAAHYLADYALQNAYVADAKAHPERPDWAHALTAHAVHHATLAGLALLLVGIVPAYALIWAIVVGVTHWIIDYGKAVRGWYGIHADQAMHLAVAVLVGVAAAVMNRGAG